MLKAIFFFTTAAFLMNQVEATVSCTVDELQMWLDHAESDLMEACKEQTLVNSEATCPEKSNCLSWSQQAITLPDCDYHEIQNLLALARECVAGGASPKLVSFSIVLISSIVYLLM